MSSGGTKDGAMGASSSSNYKSGFNYIRGTRDGDSLKGTEGADWLAGWEGHDYINGGQIGSPGGRATTT